MCEAATAAKQHVCLRNNPALPSSDMCGYPVTRLPHPSFSVTAAKPTHRHGPSTTAGKKKPKLSPSQVVEVRP
jgi:hypothetical protein